MARIRTVKPEFFTHPEIVRVSISSRVLLLSLLTQADDEGRLYDQPTKIRGEAFGEEDRVNVPALLNELAGQGRIRRYEVDGRRCIQVMNFGRHQSISHPRPSVIPPEVLHASSRKPPGTLPEASVTPPGGNGMEGKGKELEPKDLPQAAEVEGTDAPEPDPLDTGFMATPRGWTDLEASLYRKLFTRDSAWGDLTFAALNKLNREFTKPVVEQALQHAWEESAMGELAVEAGAFPLLKAICERIKSGVEPEPAAAPEGGYLDG